MQKFLPGFILFIHIGSYGQSGLVVQGTVKDSKRGEPLVGISVLIKGTTKGTMTDLEGNFKLELDSSAVLAVQLIGYEKKEVRVSESSTLIISLSEESKQIEEVVVTAIVIKKEKKELGYSTQEVKSQEIIDSKETNIVNALSSKVAGVQVNSSSGSPGASTRIRLRGNTSLMQNNDPLFVVDGIPIDNSGGERTRDLESSNRAIDINPDDVASITVFKGPAATALYGI